MILLGKYKLVQTIGKGRFGKVVIAQQNNGTRVAIKIIPLFKIHSQDNPKNPIKIYVEGQKICMLKLKSPYLVKLLELSQDQINMYLIFQYCNSGNLRDLITKQKKQFTMREAIQYTSHIIIGLQELHKQNYLHQNIKPQNILFHKDSTNKVIAKISDFGFSIQDKYQNQAQNYAFMAPELFIFHEFSYSVDIWAVGVAFYYMLNQKFPFHSDRSNLFKGQDTTQAMKICQQFDPKKMKFNKDAIIIQFFQMIFKFDPEQRINFNTIKQHQLFKEYFHNEQMLMQSQQIYMKKFDKELNRLQAIIQKQIFLKSNIQIFQNSVKISQFHYQISLLILRYYLIRLQKLQNSLQNNDKMILKNIGLKKQFVQQFIKIKQYKNFRIKIRQYIQEGNIQYNYLLNNNVKLNKLIQEYPDIKQILLCSLPLKQSQYIKFFTIFRKILAQIENQLIEVIKKKPNSIQQFLRLLLRIEICRSIDKFFDQSGQNSALQFYFTYTKTKNIDINHLDIWLDNQNKIKIKKTLVLIDDQFKKILL